MYLKSNYNMTYFAIKKRSMIIISCENMMVDCSGAIITLFDVGEAYALVTTIALALTDPRREGSIYPM